MLGGDARGAYKYKDGGSHTRQLGEHTQCADEDKDEYWGTHTGCYAGGLTWGARGTHIGR